jgi:TPR repeat protein
MIQFARRITTILMLSLLLGGCAHFQKAYIAEELQQGRLTFESGKFERAFCQLLPLAADGVCEAQYAVGYMYYYGYGVPRDTVSGIFWIKRAAEKNYSPAMQALREFEKHQEIVDPAVKKK